MSLVRSLLGETDTAGLTIASVLLEGDAPKDVPMNLYRSCPDPMQGIDRRIHREHLGCF